MIDRYTKVVLTVIAVCLVVIVARDIPIVRVAVAETTGYRDAPTEVIIRGIDECSSCRWESLPVKIMSR